ncbi:hypothetical protein BT63DRAFT_158684 [Microthyrium microscopicum]|uniref:Uncharacterized protein n=1 Tax=Microthyrium microscopicum TaxID=703497 RepID=A0A6A6UPY6_9PEZI|nr:hypothetical protein BT63DRAFT_158684 [Microthyrium microscopicum]
MSSQSSPAPEKLSWQDHLAKLQQIVANTQKKYTGPPVPLTSSNPPTPPSIGRPQHARISPPPPTDPSSIVEWPPALRHVRRLERQNVSLQESVRSLIREHRAHEENWWHERSKLSTQAELKVYDMKVYAAQVAMRTHMAGKLGEMGIPFFGEIAEKNVRDCNTGAGSITAETRLLDLQRKMLDYLESAYGEDDDEEGN